jgi:hypothetical protein
MRPQGLVRLLQTADAVTRPTRSEDAQNVSSSMQNLTTPHMKMFEKPEDMSSFKAYVLFTPTRNDDTVKTA